MHENLLENILLFINSTVRAEIPNDLVTHLWEEPLAWGIYPIAPFYRNSKHFSSRGALVCRASGFVCGDVKKKTILS
jgi:hypothetical protein